MAEGVRKIHKVPALLRHNSDAYDPKVVSFGPYHHGKEDLQLCENAKPFSVQKFFDGSGGDYKTSYIYRQIMPVIEDARNCYVEGSSTDKYSKDEFAEMMLRDACFLIYLMQIDTRHETEYDCFIYESTGEGVLSLAFGDIFLLENQIPFSIVTLLISWRYDTPGEKALRNFLHRTIWANKQPNATHWMAEAFKGEQLPLHLLEAFHIVLVGDPTAGGKTRDKKKDNVNVNVVMEKYEKDNVDVDVNVDMEKNEKDNVDVENYINFRSAKDLKARGIHFNPSPTPSLEDITFVSHIFYGELQLPSWFVTPITKVFFPNMIAYELCPENNVETTVVISYLNFMKRLIESSADVKELRENNILRTTLGSDEEVAKFFKELNTCGVQPVNKFLEVIKKNVEQHYHSRSRTWMAEIIHNYFGSPLAIIGWLAGLLLFGLTIVQTIYTIRG